MVDTRGSLSHGDHFPILAVVDGQRVLLFSPRVVSKGHSFDLGVGVLQYSVRHPALLTGLARISTADPTVSMRLYRQHVSSLHCLGGSCWEDCLGLEPFAMLWREVPLCHHFWPAELFPVRFC